MGAWEGIGGCNEMTGGSRAGRQENGSSMLEDFSDVVGRGGTCGKSVRLGWIETCGGVYE